MFERFLILVGQVCLNLNFMLDLNPNSFLGQDAPSHLSMMPTQSEFNYGNVQGFQAANAQSQRGPVEPEPNDDPMDTPDAAGNIIMVGS